MTTASSYIVDFSGADNKNEPETGAIPLFKARTCPATIAVGDPFRLIVQGPSAFFIRWPYTASLVKQPDATDDYSEHLNLGGNGTLEAFAPIARLVSVTAVSPLIDASPAVVLAAGSMVSGRQSLGKLVLMQALWGTVEVAYQAHTQSWQCDSGLSNPGEYAFQVVYIAPLFVGGVQVGEREITEMVTFQVDGVPADTGRTDFCSDLGGPV